MLYRGQIQKFILIKYQNAWKKEPTKWFTLDDLVNGDDFEVLKEWEIKTIDDLHPYIVDLDEGGLVERKKAFFKITKNGRDELQTTYNLAYIRRQQTKKLEEKREREAEKNEQRLQHKEMVQVAKDANKWIKVGVVIAIVLGASGLIISLLTNI